MPRYLISFDDGSMDHIPEEDWPMVGEASHAVVREIKQAGAWIFGGGVLRQQASIVSTDGSVADGPLPETKAVVEKHLPGVDKHPAYEQFKTMTFRQVAPYSDGHITDALIAAIDTDLKALPVH